MILSIVIINYNVKYFAEQCLCSVQKAIAFYERTAQTNPYPSLEVIVIDNCSSDNSLEYLRPLFPWVNFIENKVNTGYAVANNQGWKMTKGKYVLFLNPDTILSEDCLASCLSFIEKTPDAGAMGIKMFNGKGIFLPESKRGFPTPMVAFYKMTGLSRLFPSSKKFARYYLGHLPNNQTTEVDVLSGAFMLVSKPLLVATGGFDERFFMYAEDIDLSRRIQIEGFKNYYFADSCIIHFKGESTPFNFSYTKKFYGAMLQFVKKYYKNKISLFSILLQVAIIVSAGLSAITKLFPIQRKSLSTHKNKLNTLIVGNKNSTAEVCAILNKQDKISRTVQQVSEEEGLKKFRSHPEVDEVIWVMDHYNIGEIIEQIQHLPSKTIIYFHAASSNSIVGSNTSLPH